MGLNKIDWAKYEKAMPFRFTDIFYKQMYKLSSHVIGDSGEEIIGVG